MPCRPSLAALLRLLPLLVLGLSPCREKDAEPLPPETMTGATTFGCQIDGRVFVPRDGAGKSGLFPQYVNLGPGKGGGYYLNLPARDRKATGGVSITTDSLLVEEGRTYPFQNRKGSAQAFYTAGLHYRKRDLDAGELTITRFYRQQGILAGRFHFVGTNITTGKQVHVTDGRFDVQF